MAGRFRVDAPEGHRIRDGTRTALRRTNVNMTTKCPACKSTHVRRSHWRRGDPAGRMLLYSAYRCRDCHERFFRLARGPFIAVGALALAALAIGIGIAIGTTFIVEAEVASVAESIDRSPPLVLSETNGPAAPPPLPERETVVGLADQGDARAQYQLGMSYRAGEASRRDYPLSYQWLEKSAQQGYAEAQYALGVMHLAGDGVLQSFPAAFKWFERAARQNHADAQYNLGRMYRRGYGVTASNSLAYMWFNLAAAQGHERAREARDNLLALLSPEEVKKAQQASQEWRPETVAN